MALPLGLRTCAVLSEGVVSCWRWIWCCLKAVGFFPFEPSPVNQPLFPDPALLKIQHHTSSSECWTQCGIDARARFYITERSSPPDSELQVFEKANVLVMLYHVDEASTACCVPVEPLKKLLPPKAAVVEA